MAHDGDEDTATVRVPFAVRRRGGRRLVSAANATTPAIADASLTETIAKAFAWQRRLDSGDAGGLEDIAQREGIDTAQVSRFLGVLMLSPRAMEVILSGGQPRSLTAGKLLTLAATRWADQARILGMD